MRVIIKHPEHDPYVADIPNTLDALQGQVGGYIEVVSMKNYVVICNEEGILLKLPYNFTLNNRHHFFGTVIIAGTADENFADVPDEVIKEFDA